MSRIGCRRPAFSGSCITPSLWSTSSVGALAGADYLTLVLAPTGALHLAMQDPGGLGAIYSRQNGPPVLLGGEAAYTAMGVSGTGVLHLLFYRQTDLVHAVCASGCDAPGGWQEMVVDTEGDVGSYPSVAVDVGGGVHVTYFESGEGQAVLMSGYLGSIGFGFPAAMGAWAADPSRTIVAVTGDQNANVITVISPY